MSDEDEDNEVSVIDIEDCFAKRESDSKKSLLIQTPDDDEHWIPKSQIDDDSEVFSAGHSGKLVITKWIAEEKDIVDQGTERCVRRDGVWRS